MSVEPNLEEQAHLADTKRRADERQARRELICELLIAAAFFATVAGLCWADPPRAFAVGPALVCVGVLVVATKVRFDTPFGFTVATQLAFVPLLFALPVTLVPLAVVFALVLARLPQVLTGQVPAERLLRTIGNASFALGPVAVLALTHVAPRAAGAALLLAVLAAQIAVDFGVSTVRTQFERGVTFVEQLRDWWVYVIDIALSPIALLVAETLHRTTVVALVPLPLLALLGLFGRERTRRLEGLLELNSAYRGTALVLGDVIETDDGYTGEHSRSVLRLARAVGIRLGLDAEQRRNLDFAAMLHDLGKISIPKEIINKTGRLTAEEWQIVKRHTVEGQQMLDRIGGFMHDVGHIVRSHHERWDGEGYPDGLAGEAIPIEARIITCCDSWNAMRTDRSYRAALSWEAALTELDHHTGGQFDPAIVPVFVSVLQELGELPARAAGLVRAA